MAQIFTITTVLATITTVLAVVVGYSLWRYGRARLARKAIRVTVRLDRDAPGAHLIWDITNASAVPVTLVKLIVHGRRGANSLTLEMPHRLDPQDSLVLPTDVDWSVLAAKSIAVVDADGREHPASHRQLAGIQEHLHKIIDRRAPTTSAREFLFGATDLAFGVVILGLGFFMLMWVIATG
jgi:hypothetical protein